MQVEQEKARRGYFFNGCQHRAARLLSDLEDIGMSGLIIVTNSIDGLSHESGAFFSFHHAVLVKDYRVFDPSYTKCHPLPLDSYIQASFHFPSRILLWKKNDSRKPIGFFDEKKGVLVLDDRFVDSFPKKRRCDESGVFSIMDTCYADIIV
jgi:hypothetical protein